MAILSTYLRPASLEEADHAFASSNGRAVLLAGGTQLVGALETRELPDVEIVIDLQALGLDALHVEASTLVIGAGATLTRIIGHPVAATLAGGLLPRAAVAEGPVNLRNAATVGGLVAAAEADSEFYAALLALDAQVVQYAAGQSTTTPLAELAAVTGIITAIRLPLADCRSGLAHVVRTPADRPIVAAVAVCGPDSARVALCGVAARPILAGAPLNPPDDFKGSAAYRSAMAEIMTARALAEAKA